MRHVLHLLRPALKPNREKKEEDKGYGDEDPYGVAFKVSPSEDPMAMLSRNLAEYLKQQRDRRDNGKRGGSEDHHQSYDAMSAMGLDMFGWNVQIYRGTIRRGTIRVTLILIQIMVRI